MTRYQLNPNPRVCSATVGGEPLRTGDQVTGADIWEVSIANGRFKLNGRVPDVDTPHPTAHIPYLEHGGQWLQLANLNYGDWSFFVVPTTAYDSAHVIEASGDAVEVAFRIDNLAINIPYLGNFGITQRDPDGNPNYYSNGAIKAHTTIAVEKRVRMVRNLPGYFMSWWSEPRMGPSLKQLASGPGAAANNETDFGEREFGPGNGAAVAFSSNSDAGAAHMPGWINRAIWTTVESEIGHAVSHHWWAGIDDPLYGDYGHASFAQSQADGYPRTQLTGPWWIADIPNFEGAPSVWRAAFMQSPIEAGCWGFSNTGDTSCHFCHSWPDGNGRAQRWQVFYTAGYYEADATAGPLAGYTGDQAYANEPSLSLRNAINQRAVSLVWPR